MKILNDEEFFAISRRPSLKSVDNDSRAIIYNMIKNSPSQDELVVIPQFTAPSFEETRFLQGFGIYSESTVLVDENRKYVIWIEEPMISDIEDFVKEVINTAETFYEAYLSGKSPSYYFFNGEFPSRSIYLEVQEILQSKSPNISSVFPLNYGLDEESLRKRHLEDIIGMIGDRGYTLVSFSAELQEFHSKLTNKEPFNRCKEWLEEKAQESIKDVVNPLLIFPPTKYSLPFDAADKVGTYLYAKYGIPFFNGDKINNPVLQILNLMTLDQGTNTLSDRIQYVKNIPDLCFSLSRGAFTKYLTLNYKHTIDLKNNVKFFFLEYPNNLMNKELDLAELNVLSIVENYGLNTEQAIAEENYKSLHSDLIQLQKLLPDNESVLTHANTLLFSYDGKLALGYVGKLQATVNSVMIPLDPELSPIQTTSTIQDISRMIPLNMLLNIRDYKAEMGRLMKLFKATYPEKNPSTSIYFTQDSLDGILLSLSDITNQYRPSDINSMSLWGLWSPLAKMNREKFFPVISDYMDLREFREESMYYTFFGTGYGNLSTNINLSPRFIKGGVTF